MRDRDVFYLLCKYFSQTFLIKGRVNVDSRAKIEEFRVKKIEEVMNDGVWRIYRAIPRKISKLTKGEYINDQYVDKRIEIPIK